MAHPEIPACADCQAWMYDSDWRPSRRLGKPVPRRPGVPTPCYRCPKSEDGTPNPDAELSARNWHAYGYYRQCKEDDTHLLPRDRVVLRNNATIAAVEQRLQQTTMTADLARIVLTALKATR